MSQKCQTCQMKVRVDAGERPDLAARCRDGAIFTATCPNGHTLTFGAPLLYHDRAREQLILAVPPGMDEQQARAIHAQLMPRLLANFSAPFPAYLERTRVVPLENLAEVLGARRADLSGLGDLTGLIQEIARLTRLSEMPRKIELCEGALARVPRETNPALWAALQGCNLKPET